MSNTSGHDAVCLAARPDLMRAIIKAAGGFAPVRACELSSYVRACLEGVCCLSPTDVYHLNAVCQRVGIDPQWRAVTFSRVSRRSA